MGRPGFFFDFYFGTLLTTYFSALLVARQQFLFPLLVPAITNFLILICCGWLLFIRHNAGSANVIIRFYFISFIVNGCVLAIIYYSKFFTSLNFKWPASQTVKKLFRYSSVAFIANIVSFFAYRIDYWILNSFKPYTITDNALGNYIQVGKLVQIFLFAPTIVATVVFPSTASGTGLNFTNSLKKRLVGY